MRLINAETLKEKWYEINDIDENDRGARFVGYSEIARLIDQTPTVPIGDLISRQALIDAIEKCGEEKIYPQALIETIKALPSVEAAGRYEKAMQTLREMPKYFNGIKAKQIVKITADRPQANPAGVGAEKEKSIEQFLTLLTIDALEEVRNG